MAHVLVVDDEVSIRFMVREILEQDGHEITEATDGENALKLIGAVAYDLVITDLVMPKKSGIDLIIEYKRVNPQCKVLAMSGGGGMTGRFDYLPVAQMIGASAIISKPFQISHLKDTVKNLLNA